MKGILEIVESLYQEEFYSSEHFCVHGQLRIFSSTDAYILQFPVVLYLVLGLDCTCVAWYSNVHGLKAHWSCSK